MAASQPSLGNLAILPFELRTQIFKHFMHWFNYKDNCTAEYRRSKRSLPHINNLALLRTSRAIHDEASSLLYDNWSLSFGFSTRSKYTLVDGPNNYYSALAPQVTHPTRGTFSLPILRGRPVRSEDCVQVYANINYARWGSVSVNIEPPQTSKCFDLPEYGDWVLMFRASQLISYVLKEQQPDRLELVYSGDWSLQEVFHFDNEPGTFEAFQYASVPYAVVTPFCRFLDMDLQVITTNAEMSTDLLESLEILGDTVQCQLDEWIVECWLDWSLDRLPMPVAANIRLNRWNFWSKEYEQELIFAANAIDSENTEKVLSSLVERWAVMRAMDTETRALDEHNWLGRDRSTAPGTTPRHYEIPPCGPTTYDNPRTGDHNFEQLKYDGLFYHRRILVSQDDGIFWDPNHTINTTAQFQTRSNIIYRHEPPSKPLSRPGTYQLDPFYQA